jgi:hypothetical protein
MVYDRHAHKSKRRKLHGLLPRVRTDDVMRALSNAKFETTERRVMGESNRYATNCFGSQERPLVSGLLLILIISLPFANLQM